MNFIRDLDEVKQRGRKGAYRDILRPENLGQMRKVAGVGGFDVLSNSALNRQEELVLAHRLAAADLEGETRALMSIALRLVQKAIGLDLTAKLLVTCKADFSIVHAWFFICICQLRRD